MPSVSPEQEQLNYEIFLDAANAISELKALANTAADFDTRITAAANKAMEFGEKWGMSGNAAVGILKSLDTEAANFERATGENTRQSLVFGNVGTQAWGDVGQAVRRAENDMNAFEHGIDFVRVALGTMSAMLVFQVINAITTTFKTAIDLATEYQRSLYQIQVAQDILARGGIDIKQQDLMNIATQTEKTFGVFAHVDMVDAVAQAALLTREFGFSKDQIQQVVQIGAALAIQQGNLKNVTADIEQLTRAITSGNAPAALSKLGIDVTANQVKELGAQLYGTNHALTDQEKNAITLTLAYQHMNTEIKDFTSYQDTLPGKTDKIAASWKNFETTLGGFFNLARGEGAGFLDAFIQGLTNGIKVAEAFFSVFEAGWLTLKYAIQTRTTDIADLTNQFNNFKKQIYASFGNDLPNAANTATQAVNKVADAVAALDAKNLNSLIDSVNNFAERAAQLAENLQNQETKSLQDYQTASFRSQQDYQISVANTVAEYNAHRAQMEATYRSNQIAAEEKFQEQMRQLREKYLFDLEDALRNRDARQVLRLMAQYQMQKTDATNAYNIENAQRQRQYQQELADAKRQEQLKLQQMAAAEALKQQRMLEDYNTEKARQEQQYQQQLADLKKNWDDRLMQEAVSLGQQYGLNDTQVQQLYQLLKSYYGPGGYFDGLYDYSYQSLVARSQNLLSALNSMISGFASAVNSLFAGMVSGGGVHGGATYPSITVGGASSSRGGTSGGNIKKAGGGVDIVNGPTDTGYGATYGEAGPEAHIFLPLTRTSASPSFNSVGGGRGGQGQLSIELLLSPDLEARIQENTLNKAADVVTRVVRSK